MSDKNRFIYKKGTSLTSKYLYYHDNEEFVSSSIRPCDSVYLIDRLLAKNDLNPTKLVLGHFENIRKRVELEKIYDKNVR